MTGGVGARPRGPLRSARWRDVLLMLIVLQVAALGFTQVEADRFVESTIQAITSQWARPQQQAIPAAQRNKRPRLG